MGNSFVCYISKQERGIEMIWLKRGKIFAPEIMQQYNMLPHSQCPVPVVLEDRVRIFFSGRPEQKISLPFYADIDKNDFTKIIQVSEKPLLELGKRGTFDEFGIIPTEVVRYKDKLRMYYTGWQRGTSFSYTLAVGLAESIDNGQTFHKVYKGPILGKTKDEPYMTMSPLVLEENGLFHMFYASGIGFIETEGQYEPQYIIKYAYSHDGIDWIRPNKTIIEKKTAEESNTRPTIIKIDNTYHMWFCYRGAEDFRGGKKSYRIGYAFSDNMLDWTRMDERAGITVATEGWDSQIITYPYIAKVNNSYYMFYNGNGFGATGFGYAELNIGD